MEPDRPKVLVIEDDPMIARVMQRVLAAEFDVIVTQDGQAAIELMRQQFFAAVVTDVMMPGLTGIDVFKTLSVDSPLQASRVVFVTGCTWAGDLDDQLSQTGRPVLEKPFSFAELSEIVRRCAINP